MSSSELSLSPQSFDFPLKSYSGLQEISLNSSLSFRQTQTRKMASTLDLYLNDKEMEVLRSLTITHKRDWNKIAKKFELLMKRQLPKDVLKNLYNTQFNYNLKGLPFSREEDRRITSMVRKSKPNWLELSKSFPGRCPIAIRNRYYKIKKLQAENSLSRSSKKIVKVTEKTSTRNLKLLISDLKLEKEPDFLAFINSQLELENPCIIVRKSEEHVC